MNITLNKNDEIVMKLLHYFITNQGYNPVIVHGVKDEIWLENNEAEYKIIRIVTNYIHNDEQLDFDIYRTKKIVSNIRRKTFSFRMNTLSIFLNLGDNVSDRRDSIKNIDIVKLTKLDDIKNYQYILNEFPNILEIETDDKEGFELFIKLTNDINQKNIDESKKADDVFGKKTPYITYGLLIANTIIFLLTIFFSGSFIEFKPSLLYKLGGLVNYDSMPSYFDMYRLVTSAFLHGGILHFIFNVYALYVIGPQLESFFGKIRYLIIYIGSAIVGNLMSMLFLGDGVVSVGASGAIFGLFGALLYFGYHYRVYLSGVIKSQIIPLIAVNLFIGFMVSGINNMAHIGGLIGGVLISMAVGVKYKSQKADIVNGIIMTSIFVGFLLFMILR